MECVIDAHVVKRLKADCICVNGKWMPLLEFSIRVFGPQLVLQMLRDYGVPGLDPLEVSRARAATEIIADEAIKRYKVKNVKGVVQKGCEQVQGESGMGGWYVLSESEGVEEISGVEAFGESKTD